jgi:cyclic pyranopterin phosphate synthase
VIEPMRSLPVLGSAPLEDRFARRVTYLRVSLTDRCNYRCTYCMPEEGVTLRPREEVLSFEEIERLVGIFATLGVRRVRLTGGEPTVRKDVEVLVARLARVPGIDQVVMTTNGHRLIELAEPLARAGLAQLNVSVDSLDADRFHAITRRGDLPRVLAGIEAARAAGIAPIKLNVVALRGFNDDELGAICVHAWERGLTPRFIEWMPMSSGELYAPGSMLPAAEIRARVEAHLGEPLVPDVAPGGASASLGPSRYWRSSRGVLGIISAMSEHFCDTCNRVRLSAVGELHTCLAHDDAVDLRTILRGGGVDGDVERAVRDALGVKRVGHEFTRDGGGGPRKSMVSIGG